jgi:hypothetical protein
VTSLNVLFGHIEENYRELTPLFEGFKRLRKTRMYPVLLFTDVSIKMQGQAIFGTETVVIPPGIMLFIPQQFPIM